MGLRDRFRPRRPEADAEDAAATDRPAAGPVGDGDPIDFRPRLDGPYRDGTGHGLSLRFTPSTVQESGGEDSHDVGEGPATGEYTASGRFVVQRRFGRPVVYTVLMLTDDGFVARRTDTRTDGESAEVTFRFDTGSAGAPGTAVAG
jgi:hypothetical protein